jgi:hypothetical protein
VAKGLLDLFSSQLSFELGSIETLLIGVLLVEAVALPPTRLEWDDL